MKKEKNSVWSESQVTQRHSHRLFVVFWTRGDARKELVRAESPVFEQPFQEQLVRFAHALLQQTFRFSNHPWRRHAKETTA